MRKRPLSGASVEQYRQLVAMMAWKAWRRLPIQTRVWIGIEDMIEDGMMEVINLSRVYNPKWASFVTAVYHRLHKFYINHYLEMLSAQQRGWARVPVTTKDKKGRSIVEMKLAPIPHLSLQGMAVFDNQEKATDDIVGFIPALIVDTASIENNLLAHCYVIPRLEAVYSEASPKLQDAFVRWFLTKTETRIHKHDPKFRKLSKEFRHLCKCKGITCDDCIHVVRSPGCLDMLSRDLLHIPYDLDRPTPRVERIL